jgi:hypothetical protein
VYAVLKVRRVLGRIFRVRVRIFIIYKIVEDDKQSCREAGDVGFGEVWIRGFAVYENG